MIDAIITYTVTPCPSCGVLMSGTGKAVRRAGYETGQGGRVFVSMEQGGWDLKKENGHAFQPSGFIGRLVTLVNSP